MPKKFIPYYPNTIEGQAILNNITRTKRILKYRDNDKVYERIQRGLPLYDLELIEHVGNNGIAIEAKQSQNLVIRGECISACAYLKAKGIKVDLVYVDPPFASGADYAKKVFIRRNPHLADEIKKAEETLDIDELRSFEEKMYGDVWNKEDYLNWMYLNLLAIKNIMNNNASIFIHLDMNIGHYVKILMDEIFGEDNFINEIVWHYNKFAGKSIGFHSNHDTIFYYSCGQENVFNKLRIPVVQKRQQTARVWDSEQKKAIQKRDENGDLIYYEQIDKGVDDTWVDIPLVNPMAKERIEIDYTTQKPEGLIERIIKASTNDFKDKITKDKMIVADFFGGSGVTAKVSNDLGRNFVHVDIGLNSIQTTRDRLKAAGAEFDVLEIKDGVNLFRNPIQTMDKLATLIPSFQLNKKYNTVPNPNENEESLSNFWFGSISNSKLGQVPVYVPNLLDHNQKLLDIPIINQIISQELPKLENIKKVIAYYVDLSDEKTINNFILENNATEIEVELKDLKQLLDEVVVTDQVEYSCHSDERSDEESNFTIEIQKFFSDRLIQKIDEYNQKKELSSTKTKLIEDQENENGNSEEIENGEEENRSENGNGNGKKKPFNKIEISENGLELIELVSLDCKNIKGKWNSTTEIKIDKYGYVIKEGIKTKTFWDGKIQSSQKPLRMKIRNIAGDEIIVLIDESKKKVLTDKKGSNSKAKAKPLPKKSIKNAKAKLTLKPKTAKGNTTKRKTDSIKKINRNLKTKPKKKIVKKVVKK